MGLAGAHGPETGLQMVRLVSDPSLFTKWGAVVAKHVDYGLVPGPTVDVYKVLKALGPHTRVKISRPLGCAFQTLLGQFVRLRSRHDRRRRPPHRIGLIG